ncbi:MAG: D-alanyl-D-alanine carboxypeptidase family protein [Thermotogaceae bacterium]|nr:D-alanyl-D-alanine carboxypeptidase family protein [Thermotogaceae bacterium]
MKRKIIFILLIVVFSSIELADKFYVFVDGLNMRSCPSVNCSVVKTLHFKDVVESVGKAEYTPSFDWIETEEGWVALQYIDYLPMKINGNLPVDFDMNYSEFPLPPEYEPDDLVEIPEEYCIKSGLKLRKEAKEALIQMLNAAKKDGFDIAVASAYRNWFYQRNLYLSAIKEHGPDQTAVAKPGRSEHQLGLAVDLARKDKECLLLKCFKDTPEYKWLVENSYKFGFIQPYLKYNILYMEEPWHFRYVGKEDAKEFYETYIKGNDALQY